MRFVHVSGIVLSLFLVCEQTTAQSQPATIPTVVAEAVAIESAMLGKTQYFDGRTPVNWPAALVPAEAKIIGGGVMGDSVMFRMQTAVFAFSGRTNPNEVIRALLTRAGYVPRDQKPGRGDGGFVGTDSFSANAPYCNGSSMATFGFVDSAQSPLVIAVHLLEGEAGRQNCAPQRDRALPNRFPITVPTLTPPIGVMSFGGGSSWSGSGGSILTTLRTTLPSDSILIHYAAQLVAGGWKAEGKPAIGDGVAVQRFLFHDDQDAYSAVLIIIAVGDQREVRLEFTKAG